MILHLLLVVCFAFNWGLKTVECQFYVDVNFFFIKQKQCLSIMLRGAYSFSLTMRVHSNTCCIANSQKVILQ